MSGDAQDVRYMRRALRLAQRGRTHPNPMVGAVVVRDGKIVGEGFHPRKGEPHAEAFAFAAAGEAARGATLYVTLEPCSHTDGGRTPCAARCLDARVARVVGAMTDPDVRVAGRGFARLREAGVAVTVGVEEAAARKLNEAYIKHRTTGLPFLLHKAAMTLDGKIATHTGDSRWVTGEAARAYVHRLRNRTDAIVVGVETALQDDPSLTTRLPRGNGRDALRVIVDSKLRLPLSARAVSLAGEPGSGTLVATVSDADASRRKTLEARGVEVVEFPVTPDGRVDVTALARHLAARGALSVIVEGGGEVAASFWEAGLIDRALFFIAPKIVGGRDARTPVEGIGRAVMGEAIRLARLRVRRYGADIAIEGDLEGNHVHGNH